MGFFDDIISEITSIFESDLLQEQNEEQSVQNIGDFNEWVEWVHEGSKNAETNAEKITNIALAAVTRHCARCMNLGGCRFVKNKMPEQPLHPNCHCKTKVVPKPIPGVTAIAKCPIEKIAKWAFVDSAKKNFFESNGYGIIDAYYMQAEYERQATEKYASGDYKLGVLDNFGQRITILIELPRQTGNINKPLSFETGWMVYPYGIIQNTTPATNLSM